MGDVWDDHGELMPAPGDDSPKRARIDREGNFVAGCNIFAYNKLTIPPTRYRISNPDIADIKSFGAVGDGLTNDTRAFIDALANFSCVKITPGNYLITSAVTVPNYATIIGCGRSSILKYTSDTLFNVKSFTTLSGLMIFYAGKNTTTSVGLKVKGNDNFFNNIYFPENIYPPKSRPAFAVDIDFVSEVTVITTSELAGLISAIRTTGTQLSVSNSKLIADTLCVDVTGGTNNSIINCIFIGDNGNNSTIAVDFGSNPKQYFLGNIFDATIDTNYANKGATTITTDNDGNIDVGGVYQVGGTQVIGPQITGYTSTTGDSVPSKALATGDNTTAQLTNFLKQLVADLNAHGLISATITP